MKKYSFKLLVLLCAVLVGMVSMALAVCTECDTKTTLLHLGSHGKGSTPICEACHSYSGATGTHNEQIIPTDAEGNSTYKYVNRYYHEVPVKCNVCNYDNMYLYQAHDLKKVGEHKLEICSKCGVDEYGRKHAKDADDCTICKNYNPDKPGTTPGGSNKPGINTCKHPLTTGKYYTYVNANTHYLKSSCQLCKEDTSAFEAHTYNKSWHDGTVCLQCKTDTKGVKHNWNNGVCTVCTVVQPEPPVPPKPLFTGLNTVDGCYYENGKKSDKTGMITYDGAEFFVLNGVWQRNENGLKLVGDTFYFLSGGVKQKHTGFASYGGKWFYLDGGVLDLNANGVYPYDGQSFLIAAGRLVDEFSGLTQAPDGEWYYIAAGRVLTEFSGSISWLGQQVNIQNGKLVH